ncbi:hypothetical protein UFOVP257_343 [uncultured Caudovirales phage]|uniref:Uncharacterized protein n=1 Tax=uncultured Caudovirales phage TaxID=2100421 RepID=A0A6J5LHF8_9CAUD|nr:hypothetical protein UFOVP257_343 [uncultured Caudovirales phage]
MDTLFWKKQHKDIKVDKTTKQYFKKYLYKLEVFAPGCKSLHQESIEDHLETRKKMNKSYNYAGSWLNVNMLEWLGIADIEFLNDLKSLKEKYPTLKFRTEEPKLHIYSDNEKILKDFVLDIKSDKKIHLMRFTAPENSNHEKALISNKIIVNTKPKFQYKVQLKEKKYSEYTRNAVHNYLENMGNLVHMSPATKIHLTKPHGWMWGGLFYTNDSGIVDFVRLIEPDIIREVCELVYIEE